MGQRFVPAGWLTLMLIGGLGLTGCGGEEEPTTASEEGNLTSLAAEGSDQALAVLAVANDRSLNEKAFDDAVGLDRRAAANIIAHREGPDGAQRTDDDDLFNTLTELDNVKYVGKSAYKSLLKYATDNGYLADQQAKEIDVVFSPQPAESSHNARVAEMINGAARSLDIAMYSFSDAGISDAIANAVARGVQVRFVFESANKDRRHDELELLLKTKSGKLEQAGVDVRYVNKIMHHKWIIVDGPRDDASLAKTAKIASGSANWSFGGATIYDENTIFMTGYPEMALRFQNEFDYMWEHSRSFEAVPFEHVFSSVDVTEEMIPDNPNLDAFFTSANFEVKSDDVFTITGRSAVSDALVAAIENAEDRIYIASGHFRSRPIAEALIAKRQSDPDIDIQVYLDGQEYISSWYHGEQEADLQACLAGASTESQADKCLRKGFLFGYQLGQSGIDVKYKYYAYRWDFSYALQMHNKYLLIDDALYTGSYNLSDNAEQNTFENVMMFAGPEFAELVDTYEDNFFALREQGAGLLPGLQAQVTSGQTFPIVFEPMALTWEEVSGLKDLISANCPDINSDAYRKNAASHKLCEL